MTKRFIIYDETGDIKRTGRCSDADFDKQARENEDIIEGVANDVLQKVVDGKIANKTPAEIEAQKPPEPESIPFEQQQAKITNTELQDIRSRLSKLEAGTTKA